VYLLCVELARFTGLY
jgi:hypothetical protein